MNVDAWADFAKGPLFRVTFIFMLLGLARHVGLAVWGIIEAVYKARDRNIAYDKAVKELFSWLFPVRKLHQARPFMSYVSFFFHLGVIIVPLFLLDHIYLIYSSTGIGWPGIPRYAADALTLVGLAGCLILLGMRVFSRMSRFLSGPMEYTLLILIAGIFLTGFVAARPYNPFSYQSTMLVHFLLGDFLFVLVPLSRLSHCVLYPLVRISTFVAWKFPPRAGKEVAVTLYGKEDRPV